ncbi:MAG: glycosyltransferase [Chloroflexi bacterium]|nr:glycosyltransferase [Chloroflexota bacterium]
MRALLCGRSDLFAKPGGDTTQLVKTAAALEQLGVACRTVAGPNIDPAEADLVHVFAALDSLDGLAQFTRARQAGRPVAVSPIYWPPYELLAVRARYGRARWLARLLGPRLTAILRRSLFRRGPGFQALRELFNGADILLPNSARGLEVVQRDFGVSERARAVVVPNGFDHDIFLRADPGPFVAAFGRRDFVLCVGRIEILKNQIALLRACQLLGEAPVLIGRPNGREPRYVQLCERRAAEVGAVTIPGLPHEELASAYAAAAVHALPSWYETPGLVSLEAAAAGCAVVTTDRGSPPEYFGSLADYCDPASPVSIAAAIAAARRRPRDGRLRAHVVERYTWAHAARATLGAYREVAGDAEYGAHHKDTKGTKGG